MAEAAINPIQLKEIIRDTLVEILQEQRGLLYELVIEAMEDIALVRAIEEEKGGETATREEIFSILEQSE
jgi:hypothetical protein